MIHLLALDPAGSELVARELPLGAAPSACSLRLRCLPGAMAVHLALRRGEAVVERAEVAAEGGEEVEVRVALREGGGLEVSSPERRLLRLAPDARYRPSPPLRPAPPGAGIDLALVIDGTARTSEGALLATEAWAACADRLVALAEALLAGAGPGAGAGDLRCALLAFGDERLPQVRAEDLLPRYRLLPEPAERRLRPLATETLRAGLLGLPPSSGGDFVDALADALAACAELHWRPRARKLVVVHGDSPGCSILHPPPPGADAGARERDVDDAVLGLHERGVEVMTVYLAPPTEEGAAELDPGRRLLAFAAGQYRRLASRPELAFESAGFEPAAAAERFLAAGGAIGRGATWGELLAID